MIVCHCHAVTDRSIRACVRAGACSIEDVAECTGAGTCCGGCDAAVAEIIEQSQVELQAEAGGRGMRRLPLLSDPQRAA